MSHIPFPLRLTLYEKIVKTYIEAQIARGSQRLMMRALSLSFDAAMVCEIEVARHELAGSRVPRHGKERGIAGPRSPHTDSLVSFI